MLKRGKGGSHHPLWHILPDLHSSVLPPSSSASPLASHSSKVFLEIDNRQCVQDSDHCFKNTDAAAALLASHAIQGTLSYPLVSVVSEWQWCKGERWRGESVSWGNNFHYVALLFFQNCWGQSCPLNESNADIERLMFYSALSLSLWTFRWIPDSRTHSAPLSPCCCCCHHSVYYSAGGNHGKTKA